MPYTESMAHVLQALKAGPMTLPDVAAAAYPSADPIESRRIVCEAMVTLIANGDVRGPTRDNLYALSSDADLEVRAANRRPLDVLLPIAEQLVRDLSPLAERLEIAGSIRRRCDQVRDIELCALVRSEPSLIESVNLQPDLRLRDALVARSALVLRKGPKYTQTILNDETVGPVAVDLFQTCRPQAWGLLLFIRTGSPDFVRRALAHWKRITNGGFSQNNCLRLPDGTLVDTSAEHQVFTNLQCPWVPPEKRVPKKQC